MTPQRGAPASRRGFTMVEATVAIGLAAMLLAVYAATVAGSVFVRRTSSDAQAANFVREELDALRLLPFGELRDRTDGAFLGVAIPRGSWSVAADAGAPSAPNVVTIDAAASPPWNDETGLLPLPGNWRGDGTFAARVRVAPSSPANWAAGIAFRYRDAENHYRLRITSAGIALDRVLHGTKTSLWSQAATHLPGVWYLLEATAVNGNITVKKDGVALATVTDTSFKAGETALLAANGALASFDDVAASSTGGADGSWSFDTDTAGALPDDWQRLSYLDLPGGAATLTIADYGGQSVIKQATATVTWTESRRTKTTTGTTLIYDDAK